MSEIILGKEYIYVPETNDGTLDQYHGRTVVPTIGPEFSEGGYVVDLDGPFYVLPSELVDPEEA